MEAGHVTELIDRISRLVANASLAEGLKPAQWEVLRYLAVANRFSRTPGTLALWLGSTKGTVSQTINSLENRGLLLKTAAADRRSVHLSLTPKGEAILSRDGLGRVRASVAGMAGGDRERLGALLESLLHRMIAANGGKSFGVCKTCRHFTVAPASSAKDASGRFCSLLKEVLSEQEASQICVEQEAA